MGARGAGPPPGVRGVGPEISTMGGPEKLGCENAAMAAFRAAYSSLETVGSVGWEVVDCGPEGARGAGFCG